MRRWGGLLIAAAAALGTAALVVRSRARRAEREYPPTGGFVEVDSILLHYVEQGRGQPVVLLHGNGATVEDWRISGVLDRAAAAHRVVAFDRPGFGHSERPRRTAWTPTAQAALLHRAMRRLGIERPIVVGHSWGTQVALALALDHPEEVGALVLVSGYYFPTARADVPLLSPPAIPVLGDVMTHTVSPLLGRLLAPKIVRRIFAPAPVPERFAARLPIELSLRPAQLRASAADTAFMVPAAAALSRRYRALDLPVVIVTGSADRIVDAARHSFRIHRLLPGSEMLVVAGAGHMVHHSAPGQVIEAIERAARQADQSWRPSGGHGNS
ncbi:MAG TPA: alpha/beta hydrolase [Alphaproteobacteria bacterium]|nr:alpha/beta hydrolase [Alphaproteobacteria bacterium]